MMNQNRKGLKFVFKGSKPLEKFGQFSEINEASESENTADDDDDDVTISEPEDNTVPPVAIVAEEHVPITNVDDDDDDDNVDDEGLEMDQEGDTLGFDDDDDLFFDFEHNDDDLRSFFDDVNNVVKPSTKTEGDANILKVPPPTTDQMDDIIAKLYSTARIPPQAVAIQPSIHLKVIQKRHKPLRLH